MIKIKDKGFSEVIQSSDLCIRSMRSSDLEYYSKWVSKSFKDNYFESIPEKEKERIIAVGLKNGEHYIVEYKTEPYAEIVVQIDKNIKINESGYEPPFFQVSLTKHGEFTLDQISNVYKTMIEKNWFEKKQPKTVYTMLDPKDVKEISACKSLGFNEVIRSALKSRLDSFFSKNGIDNPYDTSIVLAYRYS